MMYLRKSMAYTMVFVLMFVNCGSGTRIVTEKIKKPLNIILMIGDGMGLAQISAASFIYGGLSLDQFQDIGLLKTSSADNYITDSAAGATAYSTGEKSYNGAIGVGVDSLPRMTILEMAERKGMASGLIATCSITHATPGSFFGHQINREMHYQIAADFYGKGIDFAAGSGKPYFDQVKLSNDGYQIRTGSSVDNWDMSKKQFWFFNDSIDAPKSDKRGNWLSEVTKAGIKHLSRNKNGFFLMVEGSQIDWGGHDTDFNYTISELRDFDLAVAAAVEFAKRDGNTLVIVTADHETGGLSLDAGTFNPRTIRHHYASTHHSGIMVPVYAFGPGSAFFRGTQENIMVFHHMKKLMGL